MHQCTQEPKTIENMDCHRKSDISNDLIKPSVAMFKKYWLGTPEPGISFEVQFAARLALNHGPEANCQTVDYQQLGVLNMQGPPPSPYRVRIPLHAPASPLWKHSWCCQ